MKRIALLIALLSAPALAGPSIVESGGYTLLPGLTLTKPSGLNALLIQTGALICLDGTTCSVNIRWDGSNVITSSALSLGGTVTSTVGNGTNGWAFSTNGARLDLGTGANDYFSSDATTISTPGALSALSFLGPASTTAQVFGQMADGAAAIGTKIGSNVTFANAAAKLVSVVNNGTEKSYFGIDGSLTITGVAANAGALNMIGGNKVCFNALCTSYMQDDGFGSITINAATNGSITQLFSTLTDFSNTGSLGTAGSGTGFSLVKQGVLRLWVDKITVARTALTAAATTQDVTVWTVPAKTRMINLIVDGTAAFDDGAGPISALTITCGKTAGGNEYLLSGSLFTVNTLGDATGEVGASLTSYFGDIPSWSGTTAVTCRFTSTGGNLSTLTTGSATFYLEMSTYP